MPSSPKPVAQATYQGETLACLVPYTTKRRHWDHGAPLVVYRWRLPSGTPCDGLTHGHALPRMLAHARANRQFSNIEVL